MRLKFGTLPWLQYLQKRQDEIFLVLPQNKIVCFEHYNVGNAEFFATPFDEDGDVVPREKGFGLDMTSLNVNLQISASSAGFCWIIQRSFAGWFGAKSNLMTLAFFFFPWLCSNRKKKMEKCENLNRFEFHYLYRPGAGPTYCQPARAALL